MAAAMQRYWSGLIPQGINRTVGLSLDQKFVFLFAKFLPDFKTMLGLVFPLHTPLIRIRQDMTHLMRLFLDQPGLDSDPDRGLEQSLQSLDIIGPMPDPELHQLPGIWELEITELPEEAPVKADNLSAHQENKPIPPKPEPWLETTDAPWQAAETVPESIPHTSDWHPLNEEKPQDEDLVSILQGKYQTQENRPTSSVGYASPVEEAQPAQTGKTTLLEDTQPCHLHLVRGDEKIQAVSDVTFYLVPASTSHFLIGELSVWLKRWMPALCETYGWQLEYLSVRPDYIKWTLVDFPEALIRKMLQVVRQQTSGRIFRVFPNLKADNASGDFWAPGYLVDTQDREFTTQALMIHLAANRLTA
jgi:REP element-mobilizing transposase RayT